MLGLRNLLDVSDSAVVALAAVSFLDCGLVKVRLQAVTQFYIRVVYEETLQGLQASHHLYGVLGDHELQHRRQFYLKFGATLFFVV